MYVVTICVGIFQNNNDPMQKSGNKLNIEISQCFHKIETSFVRSCVCERNDVNVKIDNARFFVDIVQLLHSSLGSS